MVVGNTGFEFQVTSSGDRREAECRNPERDEESLAFKPDN
jgi:hypothetical protein